MLKAIDLHRFANPARFLRLGGVILPWLGWASLVLLAFGLYFALFASPPDYQQGQSVRIMYIHVPSAWMAIFVYCIIAVASAAAIVWRHPLAEIAADAASPLGAGFTFVALVSGSLWGKPMWGTFWVWDARLTSFLILFFLYLGHIALGNAFDERQRGRRAQAILALVGAINIPIIKFSVDWWNTLHQPASLIRADGPAIDSSMLIPLLLMVGAFQLGFFALLILRIKAAILEIKLESAE